MGITKREREKKRRQLPDYIYTDEEFKWYKYCIDNDIRISPIGCEIVGRWYIGISTGDNYKKVYKSPDHYGRDEIWEVFYNYCRYYYEKSI